MRLSYSSLTKLHSCERLFQLDKLLASDAPREESEHLTFGSAFGVGCQAYLVSQNPDQAILAAWLEFNEAIAGEKKSLPKLVIALQTTFFKLDDLLQDYEIAVIDGAPAIELSFRLNLNEDCSDYYVGFIDAVLKNRWTNVLYVLEIKHTGLQLMDISPLYKNSGQALGYSIILDSIAQVPQRNFGVHYLVAQLDKDFGTKVHNLPFEKTLNDRLAWFLTTKMDYDRIKLMQSLNVFPKRGDSCLQYNRPCKHFGTCNLTALDFPAAEPKDENVYQFVFHIDDLIAQHLSMIQDKETTP